MPIAGNRRNILCVSPAYSPSFGTFENAYAAGARGAGALRRLGV